MPGAAIDGRRLGPGGQSRARLSRDEALLPGDDEVLTFAHRDGLLRRRFGSGFRFGQRETSRQFAAGEPSDSLQPLESSDAVAGEPVVAAPSVPPAPRFAPADPSTLPQRTPSRTVTEEGMKGFQTASLLNPSVNSYRRLDPHFEAPNQIKASPVDRGSMIRIPIGNESS